MKVSNGIRNWCEFEDGTECGGFVTKASFDKLLALADRIDSETVELPKSADGKIWTGREVCFWTGAGRDEYHSFHDLVLRPDGWCVEDEHWQRYPAASAWYERPDSFERIADELDAWCDRVDVDGDACDVPRAIAGRIRKLAKREGEQCQ